MNQEELLGEIESLRLRVSELERTQARLASAEQALRYSEEQFRLLCQQAPLGYHSLDEKGRIVEVNPAWLEILGYAREDVIGHWFGEFVAPGCHDRFNVDFQKSDAAVNFHWTNFDMVRKDGSTISVTLNGYKDRAGPDSVKQTHCIIHNLTALRQSCRELEERQSWLSHALDGASLGIWDWNLLTGRAYWTARTLAMLGYETDELDHDLKNWKKLIHPEDWPRVSDNLNLHLDGKQPVFLVEYRMRNRAGQWQWVQARGRILEFGSDGKPARMAGVVKDVTDQKREEKELERVHRALRTLTECNQALVRAQDEPTLVDDLCRILVDHGGYRMAWIGFADQDDAKRVRPVAQAGFEDGYLDIANISWADTERGRGPTGTAIRSARPVIVRNVLNDPSFAPWRKAAFQRGYASVVGLPLKRDAFVLGALTVYAVEPDAFDTEEVSLLVELADDLAYGIAALRTRVEREQAEYALRAAEQRLTNIIEFLPDATFVVDEDKRIIAWNKACESITGVNKQELLGLGDNVYAEPFFGTRRLMLIDLLDLPAPELQSTYEYVSRKDHLIFAEAFVPRLCEGQGAHIWEIAAPLFDQEGRRCGAIETVRDVTDLKCAEEELRRREERYRILVEESFDGIFVQKGSKIVFANTRLHEMLGYDIGELEGLDHWSVYHPDYHAITRERAQARMRGEDAPAQYEVRLQAKDGTSFEGEIRARAIRMNCEPGVQVWIRDISERTKAEKRLRESERKYRELVELANSIILRWRLDGRITFLNEFGQKFFGYAAEEILGRHVVGTIVPSVETSGRELAPLMEQILANPKAFERNVNENMLRNGQRVWIAWTNKIAPDEQGRIAEVLSIGMDITELTRAQEEIKERNTELRSINRIVSAITGFLDLKVALDQVLGDVLDLVELEGGAICLLAPDDMMQLAAHRAVTDTCIQDLTSGSLKVGDCLCGQCARSLEPSFICGQDKVLVRSTENFNSREPIHFHAAFPLVTAKRCVGVLCVFSRTDGKPSEQRLKLVETVTGQVALAIENAQLYEASHRHAVELEGIVAERTKQLADAKERAEAADHLKSAFLATMSHELRTPLNSIIGFTGIVLKGLAGPLNPEQSKQLEMVRSSSRHLLALINDVLDISKIEAGQLDVASEPFDLSASINKVIDVIAPLAAKKGLGLVADIAPEVSEAIGDQRRVEQILLNLLNNAVKFTDSGKVMLCAELVQDFRPQDATLTQPAVRMRVSDSGIGIKSDDLTTLFQPFRQIESGLSRNYEGTGLGLAICRRLADLMGGDISAESTWTEGSTFCFTLPLKGRTNHERESTPD